ncbi:penicillin-binding transpeptidase domain-containing protein [Massilia sp. Root418]|uniref:penicillin-binding transpeptidase domain-containing protein n=1 Tax=Massilia sp. Root418 TaxID=1736532 RepID=UPI0027D9194A|nr:penicillin-binding transpeptidase domain-containing protein [Massilia sp. Root418]
MALAARTALTAPRATLWLSGAAVLAALAGAAAIIGHARALGAATITTMDAASARHAATVYQSALPGATLAVARQAGVRFSPVAGGAVVTLAGMQGMGVVRVDLCSQLREPGGTRLVPLRLGYRFDDVQRWMDTQQGLGATPAGALRNVLLVGGGSAVTAAMPEVRIGGDARADPDGEPLQLTWRSAPGTSARWLGDAGAGRIEEGGSATVGFRRQGWLSWGDGAAMRVERRASVVCPQAGELVVQLYQLQGGAGGDSGLGTAQGGRLAAGAAGGAAIGSDDKVLLAAFPMTGGVVTGYLRPGVYNVPSRAPAELEDQALFAALQAAGLVRLDAGGMIAVAPRDLPQWLASTASVRATELADWRHVRLDDAAGKLLKRLYYQADGAYVRQQIDIYNSERRLLAWRVKSGPAWEASAGDNSLAATGQMPPAAARLFAELPQGWQPWTRVAHWPQSSAARTVRLTMPLPVQVGAATSAGGPGGSRGGTLQLLVAGRVAAVSGARATLQPSCTGRGCASVNDAVQLTLEPLPGARAVTVEVQPLDMTGVAASGDQAYRHLRVASGRIVWQALEAASPGAVASGGVRSTPATGVQLQDRNGALLWADGGSTRAAMEAGLNAMLGVGPEHASSVAGVLARASAFGGGSSAAGAPANGKLTLDLPLQTLSQHILDCIGMRQGRWDGKACGGGQPAPRGRHAGIVLLDAETGDILAAAGAGNPAASPANWPEVRDFDRANPARSPLRLPALQHDGGAHRSPGSTFKIVSAVGLELAARTDPRLDALLGGMPLPAINAVARQRGYAFQTGAPAYPNSADGAHITNYKEQGLDRRAQEGKLGLSQALTYSLNTWFAWSAELSDRSLFGRPEGGVPGLQALEAGALDPVRPIAAAAHRLGFEQRLRLDGGLLPEDFPWQAYDALQATPAHMDAIHTRHELRQMAIGLRMQATPLQMAMVSAAIGQGATVAPRLLLELDGKAARDPQPAPLGVRLDRIRAGMKGVVDSGTAAGAFNAPALAQLRRGLYGKTGTAPVTEGAATVWFTGWLEPGSLPGQRHRLAMAAFVSHSGATGGEHAAPMLAALLAGWPGRNPEQKGK